jgi:hypothetical protein
MVIIAFSLLRKLPPPAMPMVGTCSAAISAASHWPKEDADAYLLPLKWSVITEGESPARCSYTTWRHVRPPKPDEELVGLLDVVGEKVCQRRGQSDGFNIRE